jgi:hypothetical protein
MAQTVARNWIENVHLRVTDLDEDGLMSFYNITELGCVCRNVDDFQLAWDIFKGAVVKYVRDL